MTANSQIYAVQNFALMLIDTIKEDLGAEIEAGELTNDELIGLIEFIGQYLNAQTITEYAKSNGMSYNGAKKYRNINKIIGVKFVIEND